MAKLCGVLIAIFTFGICVDHSYQHTSRRLTLAESVDLSVKVNYSQIDGPGEHLLSNIFAGDTIAVQTFSTQFVQDIAWALDIDTDRVLVFNLTATDWDHLVPGNAHHTWNAQNVLVTFRLVAPDSGENDLIGLVKTLGDLIAIHVAHSTVWKGWSEGGVMQAVDDYWGLVALNWDASLRLWYNVFVVGGSQVLQDRYIDLGLHRACEYASYHNTTYCDFERMFEDDIAEALGIVTSQVDIIFVKAASADQVYVHFRLFPSDSDYTKGNSTGVAAMILELHEQVLNVDSALYAGNVTVRTDPAWGVSGERARARQISPYLGYNIYNPKDGDPEHRCKATHRCNRAYTQYNQSERTVNYTYKTFDDGGPLNAPLFMDFEAWQQGSHGWSYAEEDPLLGGDSSTGSPYFADSEGNPTHTVRGAHFSPFNYTSLGPVIETFDIGGNGAQNRGLVLNLLTKTQQVAQQTSYVQDIQNYIDWLEENKEIIFQDAETRSRVDSKRKAELEIASQQARLDLETYRLHMLMDSQCTFPSANCTYCTQTNTTDTATPTMAPTLETNATTQLLNCSARASDCSLLFNTSSLELIGTINATGYLETTNHGTEVALFSFDSIELGPEVNVTLVGQRALVLLSRSSVVINTTFFAQPGQISGFPGGYSVARTLDDRLIVPRDRFIRDLFNISSSPWNSIDLWSNNVNGPGSGNVRVYLFTIRTSADDVNEVQTITTSAKSDQQLKGGFYIHYNDTYTTTLIPHNATSAEMKDHIERGLNMVDPDAYQNAQIQRQTGYPGVGLVNVTRSDVDDQGGYTWTIEFTSAIGNIPQLEVTNLLTGLDADVVVETTQEGDSVGGTFALEFLHSVTRKMAANITAEDLESHLEEDIDNLLSAIVTRTDTRSHCWDGLCYNGPTAGGGYTWTLILTTAMDNITPTSPTGSLATEEGGYRILSANSYLTGAGAQIKVYEGLGNSDNQLLAKLNLTSPFSLAYGGGGAGHGGNGGRGATTKNSPGSSYNTQAIADLLGGSGGQMGDVEVQEIHQLTKPTGRGGDGGGAIEVVAMNDITIGSKGQIIVDAEDGFPALVYGGGGGSGGSILLAAGGVIHLEGLLSAKGGNGGKSTSTQGYSGGGGSGGRIALFSQTLTQEPTSLMRVDGGSCFVKQRTGYTMECDRNGDSGSIFIDTLFDGMRYHIDREEGAAGTDRSLRLKNFQTIATQSGVTLPQWFGRKGPEYTFESGRFPGRVSFYFKLASFGFDSPATRRDNWGGLFALNGQLDRDTRNTSMLIGVGLSDHILYGSNVYYNAEELYYDKYFAEVEPSAQMDRWYQIDIFIDWINQRYDMFIDNVIRLEKESFDAEDGVHGIGLYAFQGAEVWFDEIFVGDEQTTPTMKFRCPVTESSGIRIDRPEQFGWTEEDLGGFSSHHGMHRHAQHVSQRKMYGYSNGGILPFDGEGQMKFLSDVKSRKTGIEAYGEGRVHAGVLLHVKDNNVPQDISRRSTTSSGGGNQFWKGDGNEGARSGTYYWYGDHEYEGEDDYLMGGVHACSTTDFITWRNEGTMLHYINITDSVHDSTGPFIAARPKVIFNNNTNKYVMWMSIDNMNGTLGMAGVAVSDEPNGPFHFVRAFYPDGNKTYDQTVMATGNGAAYLARTYYNDIDYILPEPIMMPIWESVKDENGSILFGLNYHRAFYEPEYDNFHDIYLQRWRNEDKPWEVICVNRITGANRTIDPLTDRNLDGSYCTSPDEYKVVLGQGNPFIRSRFKDPNATVNNQWLPSSVPGVKAQNWYHNYLDGTCGIRKLNDDYDLDDDDIAKLNLTDRSECSNIADNPLHPTLPDKLIGIQTIVQTRRTKFIAMSRLTDDYLDTSGVLASFEGELEGESQLISLLTQYGQFDLGPGQSLDSTFEPQVYSDFTMAKDWNTRFHQYESFPNDRAFYSLGCVLDGSCPVNFEEQLTDEHT